LQALRDHGRVEVGQAVLVIGAAGAVGSMATQIAAAFGAEVTGVCSTSQMGLVASLGARHVIDYLTDDFARSGQRFDVVLDTAGNRSLSHLRRALAPDGRLVIIGGEGGGRWSGGVGRQLRARLLSPFVGQHLGAFLAHESGEDLLVLNELIEMGLLRPIMEDSFPLNEAADAMWHLATGHPHGRLALTV
jgi:NADPH:quinone reductase-like Zn-dependent oxidoreductase